MRRKSSGGVGGMIVADALLAAGMGSVDALRSAAPQADCSRMRRMRCFTRQAPDFAAKTASFFLNSSQGKALFTPASGAAHNFRRTLPAGLRMPTSADRRSVVVHRRKKTDERSKSTNTVRGSHCVVRGSRPIGKKGDDELGLLRDIQQDACTRNPGAVSRSLRWHMFCSDKKENRRGRIRSS